MRILMLSWEYPPRVVGGLSQHVFYLSQALARLGHEIHVVTCAPEEDCSYEDGMVQVHRVRPMRLENNDFVKWTMLLNFSMLEECVRLIGSGLEFQFVHGHDWLVAFCAKALKEVYGLPLVTTIHATESGRNNGISTDIQRFIHSTESFLAGLSDRLIVCSSFMQQQVGALFQVPVDKISVIPNGVEMEQGTALQAELSEFRRKYALDHEKIIFYIGRLVFEKGVQVLVQAAALIQKQNSEARFIIAGSGPMDGELKRMVKLLGLQEHFVFTEYIEEASKELFYKIADAAVFPSFYEPFGIVALEAMNAGCPVVVSNVGGFSEIVEDGVNGLAVEANSPESLAAALLRVMSDQELGKKLRDNAKHGIRKTYSWDNIARQTEQVFSSLLS